jgi:hypothetical protein
MQYLVAPGYLVRLAYDAVGNRTASQRNANYNYQPNNRLTNSNAASLPLRQHQQHNCEGAQRGPTALPGAPRHELRMSRQANRAKLCKYKRFQKIVDAIRARQL